MRACTLSALLVLSAWSCGTNATQDAVDATVVDGGSDDAPNGGGDGGAAQEAGEAGAACVDVTDQAPVTIATAASADDYALTLDAASASTTSWGTKGNEALVLDVTRGGAFVGHLVLHQGKATFTYGMHVGALSAGDAIAVQVSARSAPQPTKKACVGNAQLVSATSMGAAGEGLVNAPILKWPVKKTFDDLPMMLGWSKAKKHYELFYTNENGGTVVQCGGGAGGLQAEFARWGRGCDIEGVYSYGGAGPTWERCTGTVAVAPNAPRMEGAHPILYYGDGHNRVFEDRGGYGQACGTGGPEMADGDIPGWNVQNPGNGASFDTDLAVTIRPLPVALDPLGYGASFGRREGAVDAYAPWLYRITDLELRREGKIDGSKCLSMDRYLFVDVQAADVGGSGDPYCSLLGVSGGFVLRVRPTNGTTQNSTQMTADYMGGSPAWKRLAVPLDRVYQTSELTGMTFDAYDGDGIYFLAIGDAFIPRASGDNGATIDYVRKGTKTTGVYVDDNGSGCTGGVNTMGPGDAGYPCVGTKYDFSP